MHHPSLPHSLCLPRWLAQFLAGTVTSMCLSPSPLSPTDLNKHRRYEIRMSVYNAVGEGPLSPPQEVFVGEAGEHSTLSHLYKAQLEEIWGPRAPTHLSPPPPPPWSPLTPHTHCPSCPPVPTAAPRNVAVHGATATQLDVTWEPPPLESQNGDIQGYKVGAVRPRGPTGAKGQAGVGVTHGR